MNGGHVLSNLKKLIIRRLLKKRFQKGHDLTQRLNKENYFLIKIGIGQKKNRKSMKFLLFLIRILQNWVLQ